jgi:hypothetical protein
VEYYRKLAKELVRDHRAGAPEALKRAEQVLGARARQRFLLSDAQFVIAREHRFRSWAELRSDVDSAERAVETELHYSEDEPVRVHVRRRGRRAKIHDAGTGVALAGAPEGWLDAAERVVEGYGLNVNRNGVVFVPVVGDRVDADWLVSRVAEASLAVYDALLGLDDE